MLRWFMIIGVVLIVFSFFAQSLVERAVSPKKDPQGVTVETEPAGSVPAAIVEPVDNTPKRTTVEERLKNRLPPQEGEPVDGDIVPM